MPSYDKLPSGKWRGRARLDGKVVSVTCETRRECVKRLEDRLHVKNGKMTVGEAIRQYIETRENLFSPATVYSYDSIARNRLLDLQQRRLDELTETMVTQALNEEAKTHSPKTVSNVWGLLHSALLPYVPVDAWHIRLPQQKKKEPYIPTPEEVDDLLKRAVGTVYEIPLKLAAFCGLRRSEICALTYDDIKDGYIYISKALVRDRNNVYRLKPPKTEAGYRRLKLPENIKIEGSGPERITTLTPLAISQKCRKLANEKFSFHDLRHFYASVLLQLGIPNKYSAKQMGHKGDRMLKVVYQHLFDASQAEFDAEVAKKVSEM